MLSGRRRTRSAALLSIGSHRTVPGQKLPDAEHQDKGDQGEGSHQIQCVDVKHAGDGSRHAGERDRDADCAQPEPILGGRDDGEAGGRSEQRGISQIFDHGERMAVGAEDAATITSGTTLVMSSNPTNTATTPAMPTIAASVEPLRSGIVRRLNSVTETTCESQLIMRGKRVELGGFYASWPDN